jgi:hypothetical protein
MRVERGPVSFRLPLTSPSHRGARFQPVAGRLARRSCAGWRPHGPGWHWPFVREVFVPLVLRNYVILGVEAFGHVGHCVVHRLLCLAEVTRVADGLSTTACRPLELSPRFCPLQVCKKLSQLKKSGSPTGSRPRSFVWSPYYRPPPRGGGSCSGISPLARFMPHPPHREAPSSRLPRHDVFSCQRTALHTA